MVSLRAAAYHLMRVGVEGFKASSQRERAAAAGSAPPPAFTGTAPACPPSSCPVLYCQVDKVSKAIAASRNIFSRRVLPLSEPGEEWRYFYFDRCA